MTRNEADKVIERSLPSVYGFCLKRCKTPQDAEDIAQEIALRYYKSLIIRDDIADTSAFLWTIAHNVLSNYYRDAGRFSIGVPIEDISEALPCGEPEPIEGIIADETEAKLRSEIAYLSKLQRRIVIAYYFENMKLQSIADELSIPLGTVKWHLFEAKKDLKRGMKVMRKTDDLKFNPISFDAVGLSGYPGTKGANSNFFRSSLAQNIACSVYREAKTVNRIAEELGVSPVYIESEAEYLAEYGFLTENGGSYIANMIINEPDEKFIAMKDRIYDRAAELFANELYDELMSSGILDDPHIWGGCTGELSMTKEHKADKNFLLWSLIPYIAALSGEELTPMPISFDEATTVRPDGGHNVCIASIKGKTLSKYYDSMQKWYGPCWNGLGTLILWQIESEWSNKRVTDNYMSQANRILSLCESQYNGGVLSDEAYAFLAEKGIINTISSDGCIKSAYRCVWIEGKETLKRLLDIGTAIKKKHFDELSRLKDEYSRAVLADTPKHLVKPQKYLMQFVFASDGWFILHCIKELLNSGKLRLPTEEERNSLTTIIINRQD